MIFLQISFNTEERIAQHIYIHNSKKITEELSLVFIIVMTGTLLSCNNNKLSFNNSLSCINNNEQFINLLSCLLQQL